MHVDRVNQIRYISLKLLQSSIFLYKLVFLQIVQNNDSVKAEYLFK